MVDPAELRVLVLLAAAFVVGAVLGSTWLWLAAP